MISKDNHNSTRSMQGHHDFRCGPLESFVTTQFPRTVEFLALDLTHLEPVLIYKPPFDISLLLFFFFFFFFLFGHCIKRSFFVIKIEKTPSPESHSYQTTSHG